MTSIKAKGFSNRDSLEDYVKSIVGLTSDIKSGYEISGTREELRKLHLTDQNVFWGIVCRITDDPTKQRVVIKPERGEKFKSKIN